MRVLILCTGNSCRSQMAAALLLQQRPSWEVASAGTYPLDQVHPLTVRVMAEVGLDISGERPQPVGPLTGQPFDHVITVCDDAREACPVFTGEVHHRHHLPFTDPYWALGTEGERLLVFRRVRDSIREGFEDWVRELEQPNE